MVGIDDTSTYGSEIDDNSDVDDTDDVMLREGISKRKWKFFTTFSPSPP